jgi:tetratricopeptide (TPR) repeat protein
MASRGNMSKRCVSKKTRYFIALLAGLLLAQGSAQAQHPVDVQRLTAEGEFFKALAMYELLPARAVTPEARIAAAKSAWALGLNRKAADAFDAILRDPALSNDMRARLTLSRGAIEFQEERYPEASLFAEKAISYLPEPSPLRGRAYLLWGQSLSRSGAHGSAAEKLAAALQDAGANDKPEIYFALGSAEMKLGQFADAERHLKSIPTDHERASATVRLLATIALETHQADRARFWIEKGRKEYSESFIDSWGSYGLLQVALSKGELSAARDVLADSQKQYPPSDPWLILMQAALEQAEWKKGTEARQQ